MEYKEEFNDGWTSAYNPVIYEPPAYEEEAPKKKKKEKKEKKTYKIPLLILIQIGVCFAALIAAFALKTIGGDIYDNVRTIYYENFNRELIMSETFEEYSLDKLINGTEN